MGELYLILIHGGAIPNLNTWGAIPNLNTWEAIPNLNTWGAIPNLNTWGGIPNLNTCAAANRAHRRRARRGRGEGKIFEDG